MVVLLSFVAGGILLILAATQSTAVAFFLRHLAADRHGDRVTPDFLPSAAIVLALRGPDPSLGQTLHGLANQRYPDYTVHLVFDSEQDSALPVVENFLKDHRPENFFIEILGDRKETGSLKCSAVAWMIRNLSPERKVVALIDADAPPRENWLAALVAPLDDPSVGAVTGNRWFAPEDARWGTVVRYLWNAAAIVQVWFNRIAWAGSMAMRTETARQPDLLEAWERSLSVDATVTRFVKGRGLSVKFAPSVIMPNRESIGLPEFRHWVERQMIAAGTSGSGWLTISLHALVLPALQVAAVLLLPAAVAMGRVDAAVYLAAALSGYWASNLLSLAVIERQIRRSLRNQSRPVPPAPPAVKGKLLPGMGLGLAISAIAFTASYFRRKIRWRGIEYRIGGKRTIRMIAYRPYTDSATSQNSVT